MTIQELKDKKILIAGLGTNNKHLAEYLKKNQLDFEVVQDWQDLNELKPSFAGADIVFRSPGIPYLSNLVQEAKKKGTVIYSQTKLFFDLCPAPIIGVTGTKGKGTTATLINLMLERSGKKVWLAGNIGQDPFEFLDDMSDSDIVVLELSSFQLQDLHKSPHIAVVLRTTSEHLDHHKDTAEYIEAKKNIVSHQTEDDFAVLNYDDEVSKGFAGETPAHIFWNSTEQVVKPGCFVRDETIITNDVESGDSGEIEVLPAEEVGLLGRFNLENITAAVSAVAVAGYRDINEIRKVLRDFKGLEHRLEFVKEISGVKFYNDSFSTTPETAVAAISAFDEPLVLIIGGSEKGSDYQGLAKTISQSKIKALVTIGKTGPSISKQARKAGYQGKIVDNHPEDMEEIVQLANDCADEGDVVLLSPASASFDMFTDYKHRGELFRKFVKLLE